MNLNHIRAVLFDLDNTLHDRTNTFKRYAGSLVDKYLPHLDSADHYLDRIIELDQDGYKIRHLFISELLEELPWKKKPSHEELLEFCHSEYMKHILPMKQAKEVLHHVRGKYKTGIITNGRTSIQYEKLDRLGIRHDFDVVIVSEEIGVKKPDPKIFEIALNRLQVRPEECIFVGDHPVNDMEGAANVGMHTIWIKANQSWREGITAKPLYCIDELGELLDLL